MTTYRAVIDDVLDDIQTNVTGLDSAIRYPSEPFMYLSERSLACWLDTEESNQEEGPTGARHFRELYVLRYWEPAPFDETHKAMDSGEALALENTYEAVRDRFMTEDAQTWGDSAPLWFLTGRLIAGGSREDGFVRGFEIRFWCRRFRAFD